MTCHICGSGFQHELEGLECDSCELATHRDICGAYLQFDTPWGETVHFLCNECIEVPSGDEDA